MQLRTLATHGEWMVNSDPIYIPDADTAIDHDNIASEESGRDESGYMHIFWLRKDVTKVGLHYALLTGEELQYLRSRMQGKEFQFTFVDEDSTKTIEAYTGKISATLFTKFGDTNIYKDVSINVIEK